MKAPEKIYLFENTITETPDDRWLSKRSDKNDIEYIRTDTFIEKAVNWLSEHANDYVMNDKYHLPNGGISRDWLKVRSDMFGDFRNAMKGE